MTAARFPSTPGRRDFSRGSAPTSTIVEQVFKGEKSFVVKDPTTQKYFRFGAVEIA